MNLKPPPPDIKVRHCVFSISYSRKIKLSFSIVKFTRSISTRNRTINNLSLNFAQFVQITVLLPKCYPFVTEMIPNSVTVRFTRTARLCSIPRIFQEPSNLEYSKFSVGIFTGGFRKYVMLSGA